MAVVLLYNSNYRELVKGKIFISQKSFFFSGLSLHTAATKKNPFLGNEFSIVKLK